MIAAEIAVATAGTLLVLWTLISAVKTVILPRAVATALTRIHFRAVRHVADVLASPRRPFETRDRIMALYAPVALVLLPGVWVALVITGFTGIFWSIGEHPVAHAFALSGASLTTLGFDRPHGSGHLILSFAEAGIGLGIVSLMISYLPTIYASFRTREALVGMLTVRAGSPPTSAELLIRYNRIGWLARIGDDLFERWERWFIDVEESHTSQGSLVFFRSPHPDRHWLTAAGCVLDTAALVSSTIDIERSARPDLLLRSGFVCLRRIADFYGIDYDPDPHQDDPILISRDEYDEVCAELRDAGVPLQQDLDQAWLNFSGWRVNYDTVLVELCALVMAPPAKWSSDRMPEQRQVPSLRTTRTNRRVSPRRRR